MLGVDEDSDLTVGDVLECKGIVAGTAPAPRHYAQRRPSSGNSTLGDATVRSPDPQHSCRYLPAISFQIRVAA